MSFSSDVKAQLGRTDVKAPKTAAAELWGLSLGKKAYPERQSFLEKRAGGVTVSEEDLERDAAAAFLRGCFIACGTVSDPTRSIHLELRFTGSAALELCRETMLMSGFEPRVSSRRGYLLLYMKRMEMIAGFFGFIGAHKAMMEFESVSVDHSYTGNVNRTMNCDLANIDKTMAAGRKRAELIRLLKDSGRFNGLPERVRKAAELRLAYPEASLEDLGKMLDPPLSKSGVAHRLRQLKE